MAARAIDTEKAAALRPASRGDSRKKELADIAERMFLRHGYADTTMNMIAKEAHASKETLYRYFSSKEALLSEIVHARALRLSHPPESAAPDGPPDEVLFELGCRLLTTLTQISGVGLVRVVVAETPRAPELGDLFWSQGPLHVQNNLVAYLTKACASGFLRCEDPELAARLFIGAVLAAHQLKALISKPALDLEEVEIKRHVAGAVTMFMRCYGAVAHR